MKRRYSHASTFIYLHTDYGDNVAFGGHAISGLYNNWANGQPDDYCDYDSVGEDYAYFYKNYFNHADIDNPAANPDFYTYD